MAGNAEREFDHVEPSYIERPGVVEPFQHRTSNIGNEVGANLGATTGNAPGPVEHVLMCQRHPMKRSGCPVLGECFISCSGVSQCRVRIHSAYCVERRAMCLHALHADGCGLHGRKFLGSDGSCHFA